MCAAAACGRRSPAGAPPPRARAVEESDVGARPPISGAPRPRVIWIGLDGLDPEWMDRLSAAGKVPNWSRLVAEGATDRLASFLPILSPIVWTTEATGVGPDVHRVLDFEEIEAGTGRRVPISGRSRAVPAVWNLASSAGRRVGVVGWWATHPAEVVNGFFVSDRASPILLPAAPPSGVAYPPALDERVRAAAASDGRVAAEDLRPYLHLTDAEIASRIDSRDGMKDPVFGLARILGSTRVLQRLARDLYDRERPDLTAVYFEGTDEIGHLFAADAPPRLPCTSEEDAAKYGDAAARYYTTIDAILGQWMRRAREDGATLLVTSDHGFKWGADRTCSRSPAEWSTAAFWHRPDGIFAAWGARVAAGKGRAHPSVADVAPTVLALLGLPPDASMTGSPVRTAFPTLAPLPPERLFGKTPVTRVAAAPVSSAEARENVRKLVALGYLSGADAAEKPAAAAPAETGMTEGAWNNLGLYEREVRKDLAAAERDFRRALAIRPGYHSPLFNLAILYRLEKRDALARDFLFQAIRAGHAEPEGTILSWAGEYRAANAAAAETALLREGASAFPDSEPVARALGDALFRRRDCAGAERALARFAEIAKEPETLNGLGLYATCLGDRDRAVALFRRSLAMKPGQPGVIEALRMLGK